MCAGVGESAYSKHQILGLQVLYYFVGPFGVLFGDLSIGGQRCHSVVVGNDIIGCLGC